MRNAAVLWEQAEVAFADAARLPMTTHSEVDLVNLCAQIAVYLDDANNAGGIDPRRFRATSSGGKAALLIAEAKGFLTRYATMLPTDCHAQTLQAAQPRQRLSHFIDFGFRHPVSIAVIPPFLVGSACRITRPFSVS